MTGPRITDLAEARFARARCARDAAPADVLATLHARIERGELVPEHMSVVYCYRDGDGDMRTAIIQSGPFNGYEIRGLLHSALSLASEQ